MRKIVAAMNMTLDGFCNHTAMSADEEIHAHYNKVLRNADLLIYGRTTYQMMEAYWPTIVATPTGDAATDQFAVLIDDLPKMVYSRTLHHVSWKNSTLKNEINREEILALKQSGNGSNKDILVGSPGLIATFTRLDLIDEYQISVHPTILGQGLTLFKDLQDRVDLKFIKAKESGCGAIFLYYEKVVAAF